MGPAIRSYRFAFFFFIFLLSTAPSIAQELITKHYTVADGLPGATVYDIKQDNDGFIWLCTTAGVSRFDGQKFTNYSLSDGLGENEILKLAKDSRGRIWFLGFNGTLSYYLNGKFYGPANDPRLQKLVCANSYYYFFEDRKHRLWFTSMAEYTVVEADDLKHDKTFRREAWQGTGLVINDTGADVQFINFAPQRLQDTSLYGAGGKMPRYFIKTKNAFSYQKDGSVLFQANDWLIRKSNKGYEPLMQLGKDVRDVAINAILQSGDGMIWITFAGKGVYCYDVSDLSKSPKVFLAHSYTASLYEDNEGNIWVGTLNDGMYKLQKWKGIKNSYDKLCSQVSSSVFSVSKDRFGKIYAGLDKGYVSTIGRYGITTIRADRSDTNYNPVVRIFVKDDYVLFGLDHGGVICYREANHQLSDFSYILWNGQRSKRKPAVKGICKYKNGFAIASSGAIHIHPEQINTTIPNNAILKSVDTLRIRRYCVYSGTKDILWYSDTRGLNSFDGSVNTNYPVVKRYTREKISGIAETADSTLVLTTYGQGLLFFKNQQIVSVFTEKDGLANNICKKVFVHGNDVYVATIKGVTTFTYNSGNISGIKQFNTANGLASNDVNDLYVDDSEICIATSGGLTVFNAHQAEQPATIPPVYITKVRCNDALLRIDSMYTLNYQQNSMHFEYIGISFRSASDLHYQYKLQESEPWRDTRNTVLDFPSLPHGNYMFQLRAKVFNGPWSPLKTFQFTILPPFWKTNWFLGACIFLFLLSVVAMARYRIRRSESKRNEELKIQNQIINLEQQALQAMMNPHFIFNVMNSIQHYINSNDRHEANLYLSDFAKLIRMNLDISSRRYISLDDEIEYLKLYLSLERLRFGERLTYTISIDPEIDTDETMIPVMLLQPFIENALWHGILPKKGEGQVRLEISKLPGNLLKVDIADDGVGMPAANGQERKPLQAHTSKGMKMTQQRLDLLSKISGQSLHIFIEDAYPGDTNRGTRVELTLPGDLS